MHWGRRVLRKIFANNFAASRWMTSKNSATNGSGHEHKALLGAFDVVYKYATNLRQFKKFDQNRSNIHRFIAFCRNSIRPMSDILDFVSSWQTAHIDDWAFSILNPLGVGK